MNHIEKIINIKRPTFTSLTGQYWSILGQSSIGALIHTKIERIHFRIAKYIMSRNVKSIQYKKFYSIG